MMQKLKFQQVKWLSKAARICGRSRPWMPGFWDQSKSPFPNTMTSVPQLFSWIHQSRRKMTESDMIWEISLNWPNNKNSLFCLSNSLKSCHLLNRGKDLMTSQYLLGFDCLEFLYREAFKFSKKFSLQNSQCKMIQLRDFLSTSCKYCDMKARYQHYRYQMSGFYSLFQNIG